MKFGKLILGVVLATSLVTAHAQSDTKADKTVMVKFEKGASGATYSGKIKGYQTHDYTFYAKAGQTLKPVITGDVVAYLRSDFLEDSISLDEYSADLDENGEFILPQTGKYTIRISQMRAKARQNKKPNYTLQMTIR